MAKKVTDVVYDAALDYIKQNCVKVSVCIVEPTSLATATTTANAIVAVTTASSDFTIANDTSGRKITCAELDPTAATNPGTSSHIAWSSAATLLCVTTCAANTIAGGNAVTILTHKMNIADPT